MSWTGERRYSQDFDSANGQTIRIAIHEKDLATPSSEFLPVYGYRFRFNLSRFGFGILNSELTLDILDTANDLFYNLFNNTLRQDYGLRITSGSDELFWGFADFQKIRRIRFRNNEKGVRITFYNPFQYQQNIRYFSTGVQARLDNYIGEQGNQVPSFKLRFMLFFQDVIFSDFRASKIESLHDWTSQVIRSGLLPTDQNLLNEMYYNYKLAFEDDPDISLADVVTLISRSFWFRIGWSIRNQAINMYKIDNGRVNQTYNGVEIKPDLVNVQSGRVFINDTEPITDRALPVLLEANITRTIREVEQRDVNPYAEIRYTRKGDETTNPLDSNDYTAINPDPDIDSFLYDTFNSREMPFNPTEQTSQDPTKLNIITTSGTNVTLNEPNRFIDPDYIYPPAGPGISPLDITILQAELHMLWRKRVRADLRFSYRGFLDPMENYLTDFDDSAYIIVRGEYDLIRGETIVQESISLFETDDISASV